MKPPSNIQELLELPRHIRECPEVVDAIRELIENDDEALEYYVRWMKFEATLRWALQHTPVDQHQVVTEIRKRRSRMRWIRSAAAVASLLFVISASYCITAFRAAPTGHPVGVVENVDGAEAGLRSAMTPERPLPSVLNGGDRIQLAQGAVRLQLNSGVTLSCIAPIDLEVTDERGVYLHLGEVFAAVADRGKGFRIRSRSAEVTDLGTVFGMRVTDAGDSLIQVLQGSVEVKPHRSTSQLLKSGLACRVAVTGTINELFPIPERTSGRSQHLGALTGILKTTGNIEIRLPAPPSVLPDELITDNGGVIFKEKSTELAKALTVSAATPGDYSEANPPAAAEIGAGERVSSYFIHTSRPASGPLVASIRFEAEILGLALSSDHLDVTDATFGKRGVTYPSQTPNPRVTKGRGAVINEVNDRIEISSDRRTMSIQIGNSPTSFDQIRVFVKDMAERNPVTDAM